MIKNSVDINENLKSLLQNNIQILISFGNGTTFSSFSNNFNPETLLSLYILYSYIYTSEKSEIFSDFIEKIPSKWKLELSDVLECIVHDFQERTKIEKPPVIYFGIDEINQVISVNKSSFDTMTRRICQILNACDKRYFLIPILAGTTEKAAKDIIKGGSQNDPAPIPCPLIELKQTEKIVSELDENDVQNVLKFFFIF